MEVARYQRVVYYPDAARIADTLAECAQKFCHDAVWAMPDGALDYKKIKYSRLYGYTKGIDPYVLKMHDVNGLWKDCITGIALDTIDREFAAFIVKHAHKTVVDAAGKAAIDKPQLAGSTISFDRGFIAQHLPRALETLHYRNCDVSTLNELARRFWPTVYAGRPGANKKPEDVAHRGMADIEATIGVLRYYLTKIGPIITAPLAMVENATGVA